MDFSSDQFERDVAAHTMQVFRDNGVDRHLRFARPGTMSMHFDLLTWPGYLCFTGDMGTYVFWRVHDMFNFFRRRDGREPYGMDVRYWAEKLEAVDRCDGVSRWSAQKFKAEVRGYFDRYVMDSEDWTEERKAALWTEIEDEVCGVADDSEHLAWAALTGFEHDGFRFQDWERDCKVWTPRFLWCCHALEWAIDTYDRATTDARAVSA